MTDTADTTDPVELAADAEIANAKVTEEDVMDALSNVIDPELGLDFVELGLIYGVEIAGGGDVKVTFTLTTPGCPIGPQVNEQIEEFVGELDGVTTIAIGDGLRPAVVARADERGRQVRAGLLSAIPRGHSPGHVATRARSRPSPRRPGYSPRPAPARRGWPVHRRCSCRSRRCRAGRRNRRAGRSSSARCRT